MIGRDSAKTPSAARAGCRSPSARESARPTSNPAAYAPQDGYTPAARRPASTTIDHATSGSR